MTRQQVIYGYWVLVLIFLLSVLVVTGVFWHQYAGYAGYVLGVTGLLLLFLASSAMPTSNSLGSLLSNMSLVAAEKMGV